MTIKPFYIKLSNMTREEVNALLKFLDAGAKAYTGYNSKFMRHYLFDYKYFGVDENGDTFISDNSSEYGDEAIKITLEQLDSWLYPNEDKEEDTVTVEDKDTLIRKLEELGYEVSLKSKIKVARGQRWKRPDGVIINIAEIVGDKAVTWYVTSNGTLKSRTNLVSYIIGECEYVGESVL